MTTTSKDLIDRFTSIVENLDGAEEHSDILNEARAHDPHQAVTRGRVQVRGEERLEQLRCAALNYLAWNDRDGIYTDAQVTAEGSLPWTAEVAIRSALDALTGLTWQPEQETGADGLPKQFDAKLIDNLINVQGFERRQTGGNCEALIKVLPSDLEIWISNESGLCNLDEGFTVGLYYETGAGEPIEERNVDGFNPHDMLTEALEIIHLFQQPIKMYLVSHGSGYDNAPRAESCTEYQLRACWTLTPEEWAKVDALNYGETFVDTSCGIAAIIRDHDLQ